MRGGGGLQIVSHRGGHASIWPKLVILNNFLGQMGWVGYNTDRNFVDNFLKVEIYLALVANI